MSSVSFDASVGYRNLHPGMGQAVAERTVLRKKADGSWETWGDVANRVALGNAMLCPERSDFKSEYVTLRNHIAKATLLMSGRHLQHGDETQPTKNEEVFCNCSTAAASFLLFYLLLNGSGVGRCYDDDMILVNWDNAPNIRCVLDESHGDFDYSAHESVRDALHKYGTGRDVMWFKVPDSREGWAKALELWENAAFEKIHKDKLLILDFTDVRKKGSPIGGMQNRPASGPVPLMNAFHKAATLKGAGLDPWRQALYIDHYFAECVLVGGARRSARMSTKFWRDATIFDFITVKRPIEFTGKSVDDIITMREKFTSEGKTPPMGFLWSSNNSVTVDAEFWRLAQLKRNDEEFDTPIAKHARKVLKLITEASYGDGTGEPGMINVDKLVRKDEGWSGLKRGDFVGSKKYQLNDDTEIMMSRLAKRAKKLKYNMITNPCGEIALTVLGGYCVIADVVPFHADTLDEADDAFRAATRALIRVNLMDSLYKHEVRRTNRIGVGMTGVHEFAWKFFQCGFRDLINPDFETYFAGNYDHTAADPRVRAAAFWMTLSRFNRAVQNEAATYSKKLGLAVPHTETTIKPAGTTSKLFGLTEGWHLPPLAWMLRWVQFRNDDPLVSKYQGSGYPTRELKQYQGTVIVGFPTAPTIAELGMGDKLVLAGDATPEEQYQWLMLGERFWIHGTDERGNALDTNVGNQISYTLKYRPEAVDFRSFKEMLTKYQSHIRACSVMPQVDMASYEYQPEEPLTKAEYEAVSRAITAELQEDIGREHLDCGTGGCPIDFVEDKAFPTPTGQEISIAIH